ncbi:hypothetical protein LTR37_012130 [Vermiconidia calcicola]|uniref:Uncharacterized protein n=1 Tax=Vermiconidia calcicola TaxID=1690605 RepID=A0ACC3N1P7_9PEZI|nr:hypothetical protein LTR37_012130 [Vermiconidia calcicola]
MLALAITAELNGVTDLQPEDAEATPFYYTFKVQCTSCREIHPNWVSVSRFEQNEQSGSRGEANFVWRCKNCKREHTANILEAPKPYAQQDPPKPMNIITIDCRGLEFVEFKADGDWKAVGAESGTKFSGIDLTDGEWYDYDEKAGEENLSPELYDAIYELTFTCERRQQEITKEYKPPALLQVDQASRNIYANRITANPSST